MKFNNRNGRASLMAIAGVYVLYLAYELLKSMINGEETTMSTPVLILCITFLTLAGIAVLVYAVILWKNAKKDSEAEEAEKETNHLKN